MFGASKRPNLGELRDRNDVDGIIKALKYHHKKDDRKEGFPVRQGAIVLLVNMREARAVKPLIEMMNNPKEFKELRHTAAEALLFLELGEQEVAPLMAAYTKAPKDRVQPHIRDALIKIGAPAVSAVVAVVIDSQMEHEDRLYFIYVLSKIGKPAAVPLMAALTRYANAGGNFRRLSGSHGHVKKDEEADVYLRIIGVLGDIGDAATCDGLISLLKSSSEVDLQEAIARSLGKLANSHAIEPLVALMSAPENRGGNIYGHYLNKDIVVEALAALGYQWSKNKQS